MVDITPLTLVVNSKEFVEVETVNVLLLIIVEVATRPLILVVKTFPAEDWVKEFTKSTTLETIPFTKVKNELVEVEILLELMIVVEPIEPAKLEVITLFVEDSVLLAFKTPTVSPEKVGLSVREKVTAPSVVVETDKLVELAK